ncbi:MAG: hypothetical protein ACTMHL_10585 [Janibacter sp.]
MGNVVSHGADTERLDEISSQLRQEAHRLEDVGTQGSAMLLVLHEGWSGPDVETFDAGWSTARSQVEQASQRLQAAVADLQRQAADQRSASEGGGATSVGAPRQSPGSEEPVSPDTNDARDDDNLLERIGRAISGFYNNKTDPGSADDVQMPTGADRDSPMIQEMLRTAKGRATLDWMARNDIAIIEDPNQKGAIYDPERNAMVMGPGYDDSSTVVHEANHAQWDAEDRPVAATEASKEDYLDDRLRDESEAVAAEVQYAKEQRAIGEGSPPDEAETNYDAARDAAIQSGKSEEEAHEAGVDAIQDLFESGYYTTSNTGETYPEYYGNHWDSVN